MLMGPYRYTLKYLAGGKKKKKKKKEEGEKGERDRCEKKEGEGSLTLWLRCM